MVKLYRVVDPLFRVEVWATVQFGLRPKFKAFGTRAQVWGRGQGGLRRGSVKSPSLTLFLILP